MKNILITGSATGLGFETAKYLCRAGYNVFAAMRDPNTRNKDHADKLIDFASVNQGTISILELDVTNQKHIDDVTNSFREIGVHCIVNNAGLGALGFVESFSFEQVKKVFEVNVFAPFNLAKSLLPLLSEQENSSVINISSAGGRLCFPFLGVYNASKYALEGLMESWNIETKALGVEMCLIEPGAYPTDLHNKRLLPQDLDVMEKYGELQNAPEAMVAGMASAFEDLSNAPDPSEISVVIKNLIEAPFGTRPVRTVVGDVATQGIAELNEENRKAQDDLMRFFGLA